MSARRFRRSAPAAGVAALLLVVLLLSGAAPGQEGGGRRWALVAGVNDYMKDVTPLRCAVNDAREMQKALVESAGFDQKRSILLSTDQRDEYIPTKANIVRWISDMKEGAAPGDTFFFFFSGHGVQMDEEGYLLTFEADPYSEDTLDASCLRLSDLRKYLKKMKASRIVLFMDACRDDPRSRGSSATGGRALADGSKGVDNVMTEGFSKGLTIPGESGGGDARATGTFFSCDVGERSWESAGHSMGYFTWFLVRGLRGEAGDPAGNVTLASLRDYVATKVPEAVQTERKERQTPRAVLQGAEAASPFVVSRVSQVAMNWTGPAPSGAAGTGGARGLQGVGGGRLRYTVDIVANTVEGRSYDDLTHEIEENVFEPDREALRQGVERLLDGTGKLQATRDGDQADLWVFLNVCPTKQMSVDMMVRDRRAGEFICKGNATMRRPYPGRTQQLTDLALKTLQERFLPDLLQRLEGQGG